MEREVFYIARAGIGINCMDERYKKTRSIILLCCVICVLWITGCTKREEDIFDALDINTSDIRLSDKIYSQIEEDWAYWNTAGPDARSLLGHMPGNITEYFENWSDAVNYIGFEPWNPLEDLNWLEKKNYVANDVKDSITGILYHCECHVDGDQEGKIGFSDLITGYTYNKIRIQFNNYISTKNFMDISSDTYSMIKYYQLFKENDTIRVQENTAKEQGYNCVLGVQKNAKSIAIILKFYNNDELKYEIRMISSESIDTLKETFDKICTELSIPLDYAADIASALAK
ncbi:MAG: hypothetical protein IJL20_03725 [Lachnospiraceae bacterium]|nr:hypothetical protein [Lachnospiraceae bacterium]